MRDIDYLKLVVYNTFGKMVIFEDFNKYVIITNTYPIKSKKKFLYELNRVF